MTFVPKLVLAIACALLLAASAFARHPKSKPQTAPGNFDYYVMALSWSPTYCRTHPDEHDQCRQKGYGFVLHGLWPQYERGGGPEQCASDERPDRRTVARALAFMPSRRLIAHEWRAHGACTGLGASGYFDLADRAFAAVRIPPELEAPRRDRSMTAAELRHAFERANPSLAEDMLSLHCSRGELVEVRVCLDKALAPRECGRRMTSRCPASKAFDLPAAR